MSIVAPSSSLVDSNSIEPPSPTPPVSYPALDSSTQLPSNVNANTPIVNEMDTGCGVNRIFILPRGQEFTSQTKCARRIGKIIEQKFNGPWKSFKNVPLDVRDSLPSNVNANTPIVNEMDTGCGDNRIFILPRGQEFTSQTKCARRVGKIIEQKFNGPWKSFKNVPLDARDSWFNEFEKEFCWHDEDQRKIRKIFDTVGSNILKNRLFEAKKSNKKPVWISQNSWRLLQEEWGKEHYKKVCEQNKKNRASNCGGLGYPLHTGGSITFLTHMDRLKEKYGYEPTLADVFMHTHTRPIEKERMRVERLRKTRKTYTEKHPCPTVRCASSDHDSN